MAGELETLSQYQVSDSARLRAKAQLRRAEAARRDQHATPKGWLRPGSFLMLRGCRPGVHPHLRSPHGRDGSSQRTWRLGLRAADRGGTDPSTADPQYRARARAELGIASRRLADLDQTMRSQDQELDERTVSALLVSVEAAAEMATTLSEPVRAEVAARVAEQAELLGQLKQIGAPRTGGRNTAGRIRASLSRG